MRNRLVLWAAILLLLIAALAASATLFSSALQSEIRERELEPSATVVIVRQPTPEGQYMPQPGEYVSSAEETEYGLPASLFIVLVGLGVYLLIVRSTDQGGK